MLPLLLVLEWWSRPLSRHHIFSENKQFSDYSVVFMLIWVLFVAVLKSLEWSLLYGTFVSRIIDLLHISNIKEEHNSSSKSLTPLLLTKCRFPPCLSFLQWYHFTIKKMLYIVMPGFTGIDTLVSKEVSIPKIGIVMRYIKVSINELGSSKYQYLKH